METTEKRELLIAFQRYCLNTQNESEIYDDDIESFLSTLPDDGEKKTCVHYFHKHAGIKGLLVCDKCGIYKPEGA